MSGEIKVVAGVSRRADVEQKAFFEHWEKVHAPALAAAAKPLRYAVTLFAKRPGRSAPRFDGVEELWFADKAAFERALGKKAERLWDSAFAAMLEPERCFWLLASEVVVVDRPLSATTEKSVLFVKRLDNVPAEHFFRQWRGIHAENVAAGFRPSPANQRYAVWFADQGDERGAYDGFPVFWRDPTVPPPTTGGSGGGFDDGFDSICAPGTLRLIGREIMVVG